MAASLYQSARQGVTFPLADALCWLLAARCQILDVLGLEKEGATRSVACRGIAGTRELHDRPVPRAVGARQRRSGPHLRGIGVRIQPSSRVGRGGTQRCWHATNWTRWRASFRASIPTRMTSSAMTARIREKLAPA